MKLKPLSRHGSTAVLSKRERTWSRAPQIGELRMVDVNMLSEIMKDVDKALRMQHYGTSRSSIAGSSTVDHGGISEHTHNDAGSPGPVGALRIVIQSANIWETSLRQRMIGVSPRPFVRLHIQGHDNVLCETTWKARTNRRTQPNWIAESQDIVLYSLSDMLQFDVMEQHRIRKPTHVGTAFFDLGILASEPSHVGEERVIHPPKSSSRYIMGAEGTLLFDIYYYPVLRVPNPNDRPASWDIIKTQNPVDGGVKLKSDAESGLSPGAFSSNAGIVTLRIVQAKGLEWDTDVHPRPTTLLATVHLDWSEEPIHTTAPYTPGAHAAQQTHRTGEPDSSEIPVDTEITSAIWDSGFDFICYDRDATTVVIKIADHTTSRFGIQRKKTVFAHLSVSLDAMLWAKQEQHGSDNILGWWPLSGCRQGSVQLGARWLPLRMPPKQACQK